MRLKASHYLLHAHACVSRPVQGANLAADDGLRGVLGVEQGSDGRLVDDGGRQLGIVGVEAELFRAEPVNFVVSVLGVEMAVDGKWFGTCLNLLGKKSLKMNLFSLLKENWGLLRFSVLYAI